jgi:benzoylformate decarboxylase
VREATYELLRELGITTIFGNPGSTELPFLRDFPEDFRYVLALHERSAAGIALGYAMGRREPAFVNLHSIASAGNGLSAIVDAYYSHAPLVITAGQQDRRHILAEPFLVSRAVEVVKPYVKWACEPLRAEDVPSAIARAYYMAQQPPQGPVFLSIPMDDWTHDCIPVSTRKVTTRVMPDPGALNEIVGALNASTRSALVAGSQIERDDGWSEVIALAEHLDADVYQDPIPSLWTFPRSHHLFRGGLLPAQQPLSEQLASYDVVIVLGAPVFLYYSYVPGSPIAAKTKLFQITDSADEAAAALAGRSICGDVRVAAEFIRTHAKQRQSKSVASKAALVEPAIEAPISPAYLFSVLNKVIPKNVVVAEECPSSKGDLDRYLFLNEPGSFYSVPNGILGFGLPAAIGLQIARPERRVVCAIGDGSIQYSIQALWTAVRQHTPVVAIVLRNSDYSALKGFCDFTQVGRNVPGMDIPDIDVVKIAQGYGMNACHVERPQDLEPALREAFADDTPRLVSVGVSRGGQKCMGMDQSVSPPRYR